MKRLTSLAFWLLSAFALAQPGLAQVVVSGTSVLVSGGHPVFSTAGSGGAQSIQAFGHNSASIGVGGTITITLNAATTTGATILVGAESKSGTFGTGTIADTAANTWVHKATDIASGIDTYNSWICQNCTGNAGDVITLTYQNSAQVAAAAAAVTGVVTASLDQYAAIAASSSCSGATCAGASVTTTIASEIVLTFLGAGIGSSANTFGSPTNSFTLGDQDSSGGAVGIGWAYRVVSTTAAYSTSMTLLGTSGFGYGGDTFSLH